MHHAPLLSAQRTLYAGGRVGPDGDTVAPCHREGGNQLQALDREDGNRVHLVGPGEEHHRGMGLPGVSQGRGIQEGTQVFGQDQELQRAPRELEIEVNIIWGPFVPTYNITLRGGRGAVHGSHHNKQVLLKKLVDKYKSTP